MFWNAFFVVPLVGTWIEIVISQEFPRDPDVVPLVGTWIEISHPGAL